MKNIVDIMKNIWYQVSEDNSKFYVNDCKFCRFLRKYAYLNIILCFYKFKLIVDGTSKKELEYIWFKTLEMI